MSNYLVPICSSIWSTPGAAVLGCDAATVLSFLRNHSMLQLTGRPAWLTPARRSAQYTAAVAAALASRGAVVRTGCPVAGVTRGEDSLGGVGRPVVTLRDGSSAAFDAVIVAAHAPDALALLGGCASALDGAVLGAFGYATSRLYLHRDAALMPRARPAWAAWNFLGGGAAGGVSLTYWLNTLQNLGPVRFAAAAPAAAAAPPPPPPVLVTLNPASPPRHVVASWAAAHPVPSRGAAAARPRLPLLNAQPGGVLFAGAYCGYGFHEDGVAAGLAAAAAACGDAPPAPWEPPGPPLRPALAERLARCARARARAPGGRGPRRQPGWLLPNRPPRSSRCLPPLASLPPRLGSPAP